MKTFTIGEGVTKGIEIWYEPGGATRLFGLPIRPRALTFLREEPAGPFVLHWIDLKKDMDGSYLDREVNKEDRRALVLIQTAEGPGGALTLHPNTLVDKFDEKTQTVYREPFGNFPPPGVELIGQRRGKDGGVETLLVMYPGASFRIHRTGDLLDAAPELRLQWDGTWSKEAKGPAREFEGAGRLWSMQLDKYWPKEVTNGADAQPHGPGTPNRKAAGVPVRRQGKAAKVGGGGVRSVESPRGTGGPSGHAADGNKRAPGTPGVPGLQKDPRPARRAG